MKNKKSNIPAFVPAAGLVCLLLLAGCSGDDTLAPDGGTKDGNVLRFTSTIADFTGSDATDNAGTRATIDPTDGTGSFGSGDQIGLWTFIYEGYSSNVSDMYTLTNNGNTWDGFTPTWDDMGEPTNERQRFFSAYYPKPTLSTSANEFVFSVATDQSASGAYEASDLLSAIQSYTSKPQNGNINLRFSHHMARIKVELVNGNGVSAEEVNNATIILKNMPVSCIMEYDGEIRTDVTSRADITPRKSDIPGTNTFYALVPTFIGDNGVEIEISVAGKVISKTVDLQYIFPGREYLINLTLTNSGSGF